MSPKEFYETTILVNIEELEFKLNNIRYSEAECLRCGFNACVSTHALADHILYYYRGREIFLPNGKSIGLKKGFTGLLKRNMEDFRIIDLASNSFKHRKVIKTNKEREAYLEGSTVSADSSIGAICTNSLSYLKARRKFTIEENGQEEHDVLICLLSLIEFWKKIIEQLENNQSL